MPSLLCPKRPTRFPSLRVLICICSEESEEFRNSKYLGFIESWKFKNQWELGNEGEQWQHQEAEAKVEDVEAIVTMRSVGEWRQTP